MFMYKKKGNKRKKKGNKSLFINGMESRLNFKFINSVTNSL